MKKFASLVLASALVATSLVACTAPDDKETTKGTVESTEKEEDSKEESTKGEDNKGESKEDETKEEDNKNESKEDVEETAGKNDAEAGNADLAELINEMYKKYPVELMLGEPAPVDITDGDVCTSYLGLKDGSSLVEAYFSEPMMGSQAYSVVVAKVKEGVDKKELVEEMFHGIDQAKWICVEAQQLTVASCGDYVILAMVSDDLGAGMDADLVNAFAEVCGAKLENVSDRDQTIRP